MVLGDLDGNGSSDQIMLYYNGDKNYPLATRDQLVKQLPYMKKKFLHYSDYRNVKVSDIISQAQKEQTAELAIQELQSAWIRNDGKTFTLIPLPGEVQFSPVEAIEHGDFNGDGKLDLLLAGNFRAVQTELGPYDAGLGCILEGDGQGGWIPVSPMASGFLVPGEARDIKAVKISKNERIYLVSRNNSQLLGFKLNGKK
jgi:hypothetical protein